MKNGESLELAKYIFSFLNDYAPRQKTSSPHTLKSYSTALSMYVSFLEDVKEIRPNTLNAQCFSTLNIEEWLTWLVESRKCTPDTCNVRLSSLRVFLKYLASRDIKYLYLAEEASGIPLRKTMKKKVDGLSRNAVKALLDAPDPSTIVGKRDLTFMIILYATAARLDEMLSLTVSQLHLKETKPYVTVIGKRRKIRKIYLLPKAVEHMKSYLDFYHGSDPDPTAYVFYSRNTGIHGKLTQPAIAKMLKKHAADAHERCNEVPLDLHAHQFRHAKASHWLEDGMNIVQISFLLGHEQLQTTMKYLDITTDAEMKALATLEDEQSSSMPKRWKNNMNSLRNYCGLS